MARRGKNMRNARAKYDRALRFPLEDAVHLVKETAYAKFDESVDIAVILGVDPRHADQMVRGACVLPNGTGKPVRVLVFAKGEKDAEARAAGADHVGAEDLVNKIKDENWTEFDKVIATPDMMGLIGSKIGRILGIRGLMPNPKVGTVTFDIAQAVREAKAGKIEFRVDKQGGIVHATIGRKSFTEEQLRGNVMALMEMLMRLKPSTAKGTYLKAIAISSTMGPGVRIDPLQVLNLLKV